MKILTTYNIDGCKLWKESTVFLKCHNNGEGSKNKLKNKISKIINDLKLVVTFFLNAKKYDALLTNSDRPSNMFAIFQGLFGKRIHHVMLNCLWGLPKNAIIRSGRVLLFKLLSKGVDKFIVFASHEIDDYHRVFGIPKEKFIFIPFYFTPAVKKFKTSQEEYIFSGGHPHYRDFKNLLEAVRGLNVNIKIATQLPEYLSAFNIPNNVEVAYLPQDDYFQAMAKSKAIVVPLLKNTLRSAGQRSYLDGMIMGKPVIVCDSKGAFDYITNDRDGIIVPPDDVVALRNAIKLVLDSDTSAKYIARNAQARAEMFSIDNTMGKVLKAISSVAA